MVVIEDKKSKVRFQKAATSDFLSTVRERVADYFEKNKISPYGNRTTYLKTVFLLCIYVGCYAAIMSDNFALAGLVFFYGMLGITKGLLGFNLIHDALHGSYTSNQKINNIIGYFFDLNGTSSLIWKFAHNQAHHTYTNIPGHDCDIDKAVSLRLNPKDELLWFHRYQYLYAPILYSLIGINWLFYADYAWLYRERKKRNVPAKEVILFFLLKGINYLLFLILPLTMLSAPWWQILLGYLSMHVCGGLMISIVFQLAHVVENVHYFEPDDKGEMELSWAEHEMMTTANFATGSRFVTEFVGGLNFQIEHHLFPKICHVHYPQIQQIVKNTAKEFGFPYNEQPDVWSAVCSHFRTLKRFGRGDKPPFIHVK